VRLQPTPKPPPPPEALFPGLIFNSLFVHRLPKLSKPLCYKSLSPNSSRSQIYPLFPLSQVIRAYAVWDGPGGPGPLAVTTDVPAYRYQLCFLIFLLVVRIRFGPFTGASIRFVFSSRYRTITCSGPPHRLRRLPSVVPIFPPLLRVCLREAPEVPFLVAQQFARSFTSPQPVRRSAVRIFFKPWHLPVPALDQGFRRTNWFNIPPRSYRFVAFLRVCTPRTCHPRNNTKCPYPKSAL